MKIKSQTAVLSFILSITVSAIIGGCSSGQKNEMGGESARDISPNGPTVLNAHSQPSVVELNKDLNPTQPMEILADVKDFQANVNEVKLQFIHVPLEVAMSKIGGTTWRAELTPQQLQMLAVSGKTIRYQANVIARNDKGQTAMSKAPIDVAIKAPDLSKGNQG